MINLKKGIQTYPYIFDFTFNKGEHKGETYEGKITVCDNPLCRCQDVRLKIANNSVTALSATEKKKEYQFTLDTAKKSLSKSKERSLSTIDKNFANSFIKEMEKEDWQGLLNLFYSYKAHITKNCDLQSLDPVFPVNDIEYEGAMVAYHEIFPYGENISFVHDEIEYIFDDQYCINPDCSCREAVLVIVPIKNSKVPEGVPETAVRYDYKKNSWETENIPLDNTFSVDEIMIKLRKSVPHIGDILKKRHRTLRFLYDKSKRKNEIGSTVKSNQKIGRNDPCPCGSGKKYKMCCG